MMRGAWLSLVITGRFPPAIPPFDDKDAAGHFFG
jgi:hypothetical protein